MREANVDKMLARITNTQFMEWVAFYLLEEEDAESARKRAEATTKSSNQVSTFSL